MSSSTISIPKESEWPNYFTTSVVINAPRQKVWDVLVDFDAYSKWNPYIREATVTHASKKPLPDREIAAGRKLVIRVHMSPTMNDSVNTRTLTETVLHIEPQSQLAWGAPSRGWLFGAQSWHVLSDVEGGTKFEIVAVLGGVAGSLMMKFMGKAFNESIQAMANGLKTRCEQS